MKRYYDDYYDKIDYYDMTTSSYNMEENYNTYDYDVTTIHYVRVSSAVKQQQQQQQLQHHHEQ